MGGREIMKQIFLQWLFKKRFGGESFTSILGLLNHTVFRYAPYRLARLVEEHTEENLQPLQFAWVCTRDVIK